MEPEPEQNLNEGVPKPDEAPGIFVRMRKASRQQLEGIGGISIDGLCQARAVAGTQDLQGSRQPGNTVYFPAGYFGGDPEHGRGHPYFETAVGYSRREFKLFCREYKEKEKCVWAIGDAKMDTYADPLLEEAEATFDTKDGRLPVGQHEWKAGPQGSPVLVTVSLMPPKGALSMEEDRHTVIMTVLDESQKPGIVFGEEWPKVKAFQRGGVGESTPGLTPGCKLLAINRISVGQMSLAAAKTLVKKRPVCFLFAKPETSDALTPNALNEALVHEDWDAVNHVLVDHQKYRHLFFIKTLDGQEIRYPHLVATSKNAPPEIVQKLRDMHEPLQDVLARTDWALARALVNRMPILSSILDPLGEHGLPLHSAAHYNAPLDLQVAIGLAYPRAFVATTSFLPCRKEFGRRRPARTAYELAAYDSEWSAKAPIEVLEFLHPENGALLELASKGEWGGFVAECSKLVGGEVPDHTVHSVHRQSKTAVAHTPWIRLVAREAPPHVAARLVQLTDPYDLETAICNGHWHAIELFHLSTPEACCMANNQYKLPLLLALERGAPPPTVKAIVDAYPQACSQPGGVGFKMQQELKITKGSCVRAKPGCCENPRDPRPVPAGREGTVVSSWEDWEAVVEWFDGSQSMDIRIQHLDVSVEHEWRNPFPTKGVVVRSIPGNDGDIDHEEAPATGRVGTVVSSTMAKGSFVDVVWVDHSAAGLSRSDRVSVHIDFLEPGEVLGDYYGSRKEPIEVAIEHGATVDTIEILASRHPHGLSAMGSTGNAFRQLLLMGHNESYHQLANYFGATLGRYHIVSKVHRSKTSSVVQAKDMMAESRNVCLKFMRHKNQFVNEIRGRFETMNGKELPSTCMIKLLCWHTPRGDGYTAPQTGEKLELWKVHTSVACKQACIDAFRKPLPYGRRGTILGITREKGKTKDPTKVLCKVGWRDARTHSYDQHSQIFAQHLEADRTEELQYTQIDDEYPYVLVLEAGECSLHSACATERIAGYEVGAITSIFQDIALCVQQIHKAGVLHADLKPRNALRVETSGTSRWLLCDMDAATVVDQLVGDKTSSAYAPPELAKVKASGCGVLAATFSFDIWSLGVLLFELCCGRTLFSQDISNDELIDIVDQARLCVWHTISDDELHPVLQQVEPQPEPVLVESARDLIRWCLKGAPSERPTIDMILEHPFLNARSSLVPGRPMRYWGFISHSQADASSTVSALFLLYKGLGLHNWVDVHQAKLTLEGMRQGVRDSEQFILILTKHVLGSWYCMQEMLCAIEFRKPVQLIVEEDKRFSPFDIEIWTASKAEEVRRFAPDQTLVVSGDKDVPWQKALGDVALAEKIAHMIDENLSNAITYRRRDYEVDAMMRELCERGDLVLPRSILRQSEYTAHASTVTVFVIRNSHTSEAMWQQLQPALDMTAKIRLTSRIEDLRTADTVLLLLTKGVLCGDSLEQLQDTLHVDMDAQQDRIVAMYSETAGWLFGCEEQSRAPVEVQRCLQNHEAITYRAPDPGGRHRHEFQAMVAHLVSQLRASGSPAHQ